MRTNSSLPQAGAQRSGAPEREEYTNIEISLVSGVLPVPGYAFQFGRTELSKQGSISYFRLAEKYA